MTGRRSTCGTDGLPIVVLAVVFFAVCDFCDIENRKGIEKTKTPSTLNRTVFIRAISWALAYQL